MLDENYVLTSYQILKHFVETFHRALNLFISEECGAVVFIRCMRVCTT